MTEDPYLWLEDIEGPSALAQVRAWNALTDAHIRASGQLDLLTARALAILDDDQRIARPSPFQRWIYNFWTDTCHVRGIWRRSSMATYLAGMPEWDTLIDVDALCQIESANWVWGGATLLVPEGDRALVALSDGGKDATAWREFDLTTRTFVIDGFVVPPAKTRLAWLDRHTLLVAGDLGPDTLTAAGYPRQVRQWRRGTALIDAPVVAEVATDRTMITPLTPRDATGKWPTIVRKHDFWTGDLSHQAADGTWVKAPVPEDAVFLATLSGHAIVKLHSDSAVGPAGALIAYSIPDLLAQRPIALERVMDPPAAGAIQGVARAKTRLYVSVIEDVAGRIFDVTRNATGVWQATPLATPPNSTVLLEATEPTNDRLFYSTVGLIQPKTMHVYEPGVLLRDLAHEAARLDADRFSVDQRFAASTDGTRIPYFVVLPRHARGPVPILLYGYGGFRQSQVPGYVGPLAQFLLEAGCGYAVANIRGGGEYGPAWHIAALRENRQRSFDDFHAVAQELKASGAASRLAIHGGSNGGLLVGVAFTQRPELYDAVAMAVPLADMQRYHKLLAGASWIAEYGNPDVAADWEFIRRYSPYHNLRDNAAYPPVFFQTSTKDDRVHPAHARKMAARMAALGHAFDYYENIDGGHGGAADNRQAAYQIALMSLWLQEKLMSHTDRRLPKIDMVATTGAAPARR